MTLVAAFQTINHAVKRTLLNALDWYDFIKRTVIPKFDTGPAAAKEDWVIRKLARKPNNRAQGHETVATHSAACFAKVHFLWAMPIESRAKQGGAVQTEWCGAWPQQPYLCPLQEVSCNNRYLVEDGPENMVNSRGSCRLGGGIHCTPVQVGKP